MKRATLLLGALALLHDGAGQMRAGIITLNVPGAVGTQPTGIDGNNVVGNYFVKGEGPNAFGFVYTISTKTYTDINYPGAVETNPTAISGNTIAGLYSNGNGLIPFSYNGTTFTNINIPGSIIGISNGDYLGYDPDAPGSSYLSNGLTYITLDPPGSIANVGIHATGIDGSNIVGQYNDSSGPLGFLYNGSNYSEIKVGTFATYLTGISGNNIIGQYLGSDEEHHAFIYSGGTYTSIDPPGSIFTDPEAISGNNVTGIFTNVQGATQAFFYNGSTFSTINFPEGQIDLHLPLHISGDTVVGAYDDVNGNSQAFLFQPDQLSAVPEPSSLALFVIGCAAFAFRWKHRVSGI